MAASADDYEFTVRWRPFLLRPSMPLEGKAKEPLVVRPDGSNNRVNVRLRDYGRKVGIDFTGKCDRYPNTLAAHQAMDYAFTHGGLAAQNTVMELLFKAYFTDGVFLDCLLYTSPSPRDRG